jgi:hypothetical protein
MAVRHAGDVGERDAVLAEGVLDRRDPRRERGHDFLVPEAAPVVEQKDPVPVHDGVRVRRPPLAIEQLLLIRRQPELGDEERDDANVGHVCNVVDAVRRGLAQGR